MLPLVDRVRSGLQIITLSPSLQKLPSFTWDNFGRWKLNLMVIYGDRMFLARNSMISCCSVSSSGEIGNPVNLLHNHVCICFVYELDYYVKIDFG